MADASPHPVESLAQWLDASPTPFHSVARAVQQLSGAGFTSLDARSELPDKGYIERDGALVAWSLGARTAPLRVIGAHTDSPNLRVHPRPDLAAAGWNQLGVEVYGGVLLNSWLDRDLGLAGRVVDSGGTVRLFSFAEPIARVPQLAIHLDREVNERGVLLDRQAHLMPVWGTRTGSFVDWLGHRTGVSDIAAFDAHLFDNQRAAVLGSDSSMLAGGRLDNQVSCWAAVSALTSSTTDATAVVVLNDHEEVGSDSATGASGPMLAMVLDLLYERMELSPMEKTDMVHGAFCLSADNAHALHPNYQERHEPRHAPIVNNGPALKLNGNMRYATTARGTAHIRAVAAAAGVPLQVFVTRNNMPCGSTIGPITATRLGIECIDVGVPQLSMHSARELCGADDPPRLVELMSAFLRS
ncbi:MAG: M18 family aminopeptidase [Acidimicrobiales bacterium]